jgi:hypothetical protein
MDGLSVRKMEHLALSGSSILFFGEAMARLSAYLISRLSLQGKSITLLDAAQSFDPYWVARAGRYGGVPARPLLERIRLSRAFTCHQLVTLVGDLLSGRKLEEPLFILGPCILFYDDQVALKERQILFQQVVQALSLFNQQGPGCFLFQGPISRRAKNQHFGRTLSKSVQWVIQVGKGDQGLEGKLLKTSFGDTKNVPQR